jgi:hypothetical protein
MKEVGLVAGSTFRNDTDAVQNVELVCATVRAKDIGEGLIDVRKYRVHVEMD